MMRIVLSIQESLCPKLTCLGCGNAIRLASTWEQTVGLVRWRRFGPGILDSFVRWCRTGQVAAVWYVG
jgi:hypothetical protein